MLIVRHLDVETVAVEHTAIKLHDSSLCLVFDHHVLKTKQTPDSVQNYNHQLCIKQQLSR